MGRDMGRSTKTIEFKFEYELVVVERISDEDRSGWRKLRDEHLTSSLHSHVP
jgi:hypothetical protein